MLSLRGKNALVTGGSRGIGRAVSERLGALGAQVAVGFHRDATAAARTVAAVEAQGCRAVALRADLAVTEEAFRLVDETVARLGSLDIVVVNQGIWKRAPIQTMSRKEWDETLGVNLHGAYAIVHQAARHMMPRRSGALVLVASTAGQRGEASYSHYAASKGGLIALTRSLAAELGPHGIRVNAVAPGWVLTDMTRSILLGPSAEEAVRSIPRGRAGAVDEIAGPVAFLASDLASYVYGEILCVNGGAVMAS